MGTSSLVQKVSSLYISQLVPIDRSRRQYSTILVALTHSNSEQHPDVYLKCENSSFIHSLVFMGSEKYPYKGIIDHLANRGFSNGTNAWTDNDHTAYTVSTAGEQGFLQLLPIYVDHVLYPTLTKAGFVTEVGLYFMLPETI